MNVYPYSLIMASSRPLLYCWDFTVSNGSLRKHPDQVNVQARLSLRSLHAKLKLFAWYSSFLQNILRIYGDLFIIPCSCGIVVTITKTHLFKYIENFTSKNWKFSDKKLLYFSYFCSKYRLWVLVRTASARRFLWVPQSMFWAEIRKIMYTPLNPSFLYKSGVKGGKNYIGVFSWWNADLSFRCVSAHGNLVA